MARPIKQNSRSQQGVFTGRLVRAHRGALRHDLLRVRGALLRRVGLHLHARLALLLGHLYDEGNEDDNAISNR